jgi:CDP-diacylglycerol--serine O-phosphatidyltransferase
MFVMVVLFFALLVSYPWQVLTVGTVAYLACLPLGWLSYREYQRRDAAAATPASSSDTPYAAGSASELEDHDRPSRLN